MSMVSSKRREAQRMASRNYYYDDKPNYVWTTVRLKKNHHAKLKAEAEKRGLSISAYVRIIVAQAITD